MQMQMICSCWRVKIIKSGYTQCDHIGRNFVRLAIFKSLWQLFFCIWQSIEPTFEKKNWYLAIFHYCKWPNIERII